MTIRTRVAFMVILLLIGWIFAAPYYRKSTSSAEDAAEVSAPTLQIQRNPLRTQPVPVTNDTADRLTVVGELPALKDGGLNPTYFPPLTPPPLDGDRTLERDRTSALKPGAVGGTEASLRPLKPVSLIGTEIGAPVLSREPIRQFRKMPVAAPLSRSLDSNLANTASKIARQLHRVVNGDTLQTLARKYYADVSYALLIFEANRETLMSPDILPIGVELTIPAKPTAKPTLPKPTQALPHSRSGNDSGWQSAQLENDRRDGL